MARHKNITWNLDDSPNWNNILAALLMDIRDELKALNGRLSCSAFIAIPRKLDAIARNTEKPKKKKPQLKKVA